MVQEAGPAGWVVLVILIVFSIFSWTVIFSKLSALGGARKTNWRFLRAFRKAAALEAAMVASEQYRPSPLVSVFDFGYEEVERQVKARGRLTNRTALERALQLGVSEEVAKLERNAPAAELRFTSTPIEWAPPSGSRTATPSSGSAPTSIPRRSSRRARRHTRL